MIREKFVTNIPYASPATEVEGFDALAELALDMALAEVNMIQDVNLRPDATAI
jgi:hypothetical protein